MGRLAVVAGRFYFSIREQDNAPTQKGRILLHCARLLFHQALRVLVQREKVRRDNEGIQLIAFLVQLFLFLNDSFLPIFHKISLLAVNLSIEEIFNLRLTP
jgi:hypothetical protein